MKVSYHSFSQTIFIILVMIGLLSPDLITAQDWYDTDWQYRRNISITNSGASELANYQVKMNLDNSSFDFSNAESDGSDIRLTDADKISLIPFWIENWDAVGEQATIWLKVPIIPIAGTSVYIYYGNSSPTIPPPTPIETPPVGPFTKSLDNPIIPAGDPGNGESLLAENIVYDDVTGHYWMVFAVYRGGSSIGLAWSDSPSDPTSWNWHGTLFTGNAPHIIKENGLWYIFCAQLPNIVYMTSSTINGTYSAPTIALTNGAPGTWEDYRADEPYVFQRNDGKWIMMYMGDAGSTVEQVGFAEADNITGPYTKFASNPCLAFGLPGSFDAGTIADPWVVEFNDTYYIGYTVSPTISSPWQTALATTTDWNTFTKKGILLPLAGEFNSFRGAVTRVGDEYVFSYTTKITSSSSYQMGIATQPVLMDPINYVDNPEAVFDFYDGFDGTSIDETKWTFLNGTTAQANVSGGLVTLSATGTYVRILGQASFGMDYINETYGYHPDQGTANLIAETGFADAGWNTVRIVDDFPSTTHWQREAKTSGSPQSLINMAITADDNWHTFRVYRESPNIAGFQIDNTAVETSTTDVPAMALPPLLMSYGNGNEFILDWTRVRKFASIDPSISVGGEQIQLPPIIITNTKSDVSDCYGGSDGAIDITVTGGSESYSFLWSPGGQITEDISGLSAGIYSVLVTDSNDGTTSSGDIVISQPDELILEYTITNPIICNECTATVLISATGGTTPYTGTGSFEQAVGTVIYSVTDDNGCSKDISVSIEEPAPWYDDGWQHRREVAITNTVGSILSEYQVLVTLDNSFYFDNANTDGSDIRVTLDDGTSLIPFWLEIWDPLGQQANIWIRIPTIPVEGTSIYIYYGNPSPTVDLPVPVEVPPTGPFTKDPNNPIDPIGDPQDGASLLAENIVYDDVTGKYWMIFANYRGSSYGVGLVWSNTPTDPDSWNWHGNVYNHGGSGSFAPHIIKEGGLWYIFFAQFPNIVYMTSTTIDGIYSTPTVVLTNGAGGTWESLRADEPYVFQRNDGKWIMIYMGDSGGNVEQVGYAEADDITGPYTKFVGNPCLAFGPSGSYDAGTIADPWVVEFDGTYYIGYTVSPTTSSPWQTALATTTDWQTFTKHGILLPLGSEYYSFRGAVTRIDDEYVFSYAGGASAGAYRMCIATQPAFMAPASTFNNAEAVFDFYDEFDGTALDASKWTFSSGISSQASVAGGTLTLTHAGGSFPSLLSNSTFGMDYIFETYARHPQQGTLNMVIELGFNQSFGDVVRIVDDFPESLPSPTTNWNRQSKLESQSGDPGWQPMAQSADQDWHVFHIGRQGSNTAGFQIDDQTMETVTSGVPTTELPVFLMSYTQSTSNQLIVDWTRIRKWAGPDPTTEVGIEQTNSALINIAIYNTACGDFEVKVKPNVAVVDNYLTNLQFTIKWPENTVDLIDISSSIGVALQGSVVVDNGMNYAVFATAPSLLTNWDANTEYTVLNFSHDQSSTGYADFEVDTLSWASANNGEYYIEFLGEDFTGSVYHDATEVYLGKCGEIKVLLQAPYAGGGSMNTALAGNIPMDQPYNVEPWYYGGTESLTTIDGVVVDWMLVELRSDPTTTVEMKAALLLDDGSIVQYNNISQGVHFDNTIEGSSYYIVVHHRNHMAVMTGSSAIFNGSLVDFTDETICFGTPNAEIELETGIYGMIAGDINTNGYLSYSGPGNDRGLILARIVSELTTTDVNDIAYGYFDEDVLMDYNVQYIGTGNDRAIILTNLSTLTGTVYLNAVYNSVVPGATTKSEIINDGPIHIFIEETLSVLQVKISTDEIITDGIVDNVQFTLSWEVAINEIIKPVLENAQSSFGLIPQGDPILFEERMYQAFVSVVPVELPNPYNKNDDVVLVSFIKDTPANIGTSIDIADNDYASNHNGEYYISLLGTNYTGSIHTSSLGINELQNSGLIIYPNPVVSGIVHLEMNLVKEQDVTISIMDIQGRFVATQQLQVNKGLSKNQIDIRHLSKGIYYIKVQAKDLNTIQKIVKQ